MNGAANTPAPDEIKTVAAERVERLADAELVRRCASPLAKRLRSRGAVERRTTISQLSEEQRALLAFWILYSHGQNGLSGLCAELPHRVVDSEFWAFIQSGMICLGEIELSELLQQLRREIECRLAEHGDTGGVTRPVTGPEAFINLVEALAPLDQALMRRLDAKYAHLAPRALQRTARRIRDSSDNLIGG